MANDPAITPGRSAWALAGFFAVLPIAAMGGGLLIAPWLGLCAVLAWPRHVAPQTAKAATWPCMAVGLLGVFVALSALWSPVQAHAQALKIVLCMGLGLVFVLAAASENPVGRRLISAAGLAACCVLIILLAIEATLDMRLNRLAQPTADTPSLLRNPGKGTSVLVVLLWAVIAAHAQGASWRRVLCMACVAGAVGLATQFGMAANLAGIAAGAGAFVLALAAPTFILGLVAGGLAFWFLAAPFMMSVLLQIPGLGAQLPLSWQMRLEIWRFTQERIMEKPLTGWGLDAARSFTGKTMAIGDFQFAAIPLHPHSVALHIWLEAGALGAVLAAGAVLSAAALAVRTFPAQRWTLAAIAATMTSLGVIWNVSYGAWQEWWLCVPFIAAALISTARR